ncbi:MAG: peptidylprolyl isomerase [Planctomycetes bacterium]|nr:peptidylprolyl isomerase [Planctomycetota bacterium]
MNKLFLFLLYFGLFLFQVDTFSAEKSPKSDVIVTVNGKKITSKDVADQLQERKNTDADTLDALKLEIVDRLIMDILLDEFIDKQGLLVTQNEIDREVERIRFDIEGRQKKTVQPLEQILALIGFGVTEFKTSIKHSIALEKYFCNKLNDKALEKYFEQNKGVFNGETVRVSHILVDTRGMKADALHSQALDHVKNVKREIDRGTRFEEAAKKYSDCPSAQNGGDLGFILWKGTLAKAFLDTAFSMRIGEVREPVQTEYGYHLIKVTDKKEGANIKFADVKKEVRLEALDEETVTLLNQLRKDAQITFNQ